MNTSAVLPHPSENRSGTRTFVRIPAAGSGFSPPRAALTAVPDALVDTFDAMLTPS
ncbi:hypothetical protein ACIO6U_06995 [Streptomyces sp. NPDC087422]|uniref:hypothetical protein n=1 Tax=Streptomyces sp. NPDC087422 TaxID=3365786 RepID=UPI0037F98574